MQLTPSQAGTVQALLTSGVPAYQTLAVQYGLLLGSASNVALNGVDFGAVAAGLSGGTLNPGPGAQFPGAGVVPARRDGERGGVQRIRRRGNRQVRSCRQEWRLCQRRSRR